MATLSKNAPPLPSTEWMEQIIRINSVTHQSNDEIVAFLQPLLQESGLTVEIHKNTENGVSYKNILAFSHPNQGKQQLALNTHLDTVSPGPSELWTKTKQDPFNATIIRDRIYGLGTADVKLDFLCKILACRAAKPWKFPFALIGTYGEERGLVGAQKLFADNRLKTKFAVVGEPSNLELIYAHKGHIIFTVASNRPPRNRNRSKDLIQKKWRGQAAHSSTPHLGKNAIRKALIETLKRGMGIWSLDGGTDNNRIPDSCTAEIFPEQSIETRRLFSFLNDLDEWARELGRFKDSRFSPATHTLSLNMAETRESEILLTFDIRVLPNSELPPLIRRVEALTLKHHMRLCSILGDPPLKGSRNSKLILAASKALKECGVKAVTKTKASSTEAAIYQSFGADAVVFGPGISVGNVHRPNEHNLLSQLEIATQVYSHLLRSPIGET